MSKQTVLMECLLSFGAQTFVLQFVVQHYKDYDTQNYNVACCNVWVRNVVSHIAGGTYAERVRE